MLQSIDAAMTLKPSPGGAIELEHVDIVLGKTEVVKDFSLSIASGEFVCLLGPSGCGKSTLMNVVAGFVVPTAGRALVDGKPVTGPGVDRGIVFQSSESLFPWLTVRENVEYGPRTRGVPKKQRAEAALHYIRLVGLSHAADKRPNELSGGMRQRAQIARVLVNEPSVILMDEPFGALDAQTRFVMQTELDRIWKQTRATVLFITHDIGEAVLLGDRVVAMTAGPRASLKSAVKVELPHPRDLTDPDAVALFKRLRDDIAEEVAKSMSGEH
jgi:NitT/TauT family transport system ATP-binding protein